MLAFTLTASGHVAYAHVDLIGAHQLLRRVRAALENRVGGVGCAAQPRGVPDGLLPAPALGRAALRGARRALHVAGGVPAAPPLGDGLPPQRALPRRRLPEPAGPPGRAPVVDAARQAPARRGPGPLVRLRGDARAAPRGLARHARRAHGVLPPPHELLRPVPRPRRAPRLPHPGPDDDRRRLS